MGYEQPLFFILLKTRGFSQWLNHWITLNSHIPEHELRPTSLSLKTKQKQKTLLHPLLPPKIHSTFPIETSPSVWSCVLWWIFACVRACSQRVDTFVYMLSCVPQKQARRQQTLPAAEHMGCPVCLYVAPEPPFTPEAWGLCGVALKRRRLHLTCLLARPLERKVSLNGNIGGPSHWFLTACRHWADGRMVPKLIHEPFSGYWNVTVIAAKTLVFFKE